MKKVFVLLGIIISAVLIVSCNNNTTDQDCQHKYGEWALVKAASCMAEGIQQHTCEICGFAESQTLDMIPHEEVIDQAVAATCTTDGLTEGKHCSVCNTVLIVQEVVPATHSYDDGTVSIEATCNADGEKTFTCTVCGYTRNDIIPKTNNHSYTTEIITVATCTEDGLKKLTCQVCGYVSEEVINKFGHSFDNGTVTVSATCEKNGEKKYICKVCKFVKTEKTSTLGHKPDANFICAVCGKQCPITLNMTSSEITNAYKVHYISERQIWHQDNEKRYVLVFALNDTNETEISAPCVVEIKIVNDDGETVYEATKVVKTSDFSTWSYINGAVKKYQGTIYINDSEIKEGTVDDGDIYFTVYNKGYFSFSESRLSIDDLPKKQIKVKLPSMPLTLKDGAYAAFKMTSISYEINNNGNIIFTFSGEKTKGSSGNSTYFIWKLLDSDGYVVDHGSKGVYNLSVGDKFKGETFTVYSSSLTKGCTEYTLILEDYT